MPNIQPPGGRQPLGGGCRFPGAPTRLHVPWMGLLFAKNCQLLDGRRQSDGEQFWCGSRRCKMLIRSGTFLVRCWQPPPRSGSWWRIAVGSRHHIIRGAFDIVKSCWCSLRQQLQFLAPPRFGTDRHDRFLMAGPVVGYRLVVWHSIVIL